VAPRMNIRTFIRKNYGVSAFNGDNFNTVNCASLKSFSFRSLQGSRDKSIGIATGYGLGGPNSILGRSKQSFCIAQCPYRF
jgi:hypothetical protein